MEIEAARALAKIDREIWVITSQTKSGRRGGLLASWLQQISLDEAHPALLIALHPQHFTRELIDASGVFIAHLLRDNQAELATQFARSSGRDSDKLAGVATEPTDSGAARLRECLAWTECRVFSRLVTAERVFYWADCIAGGVESTAPPLRESAFFRSLPPEALAILRKNRRKDMEAIQSQAKDWRANLPEILRFLPSE